MVAKDKLYLAADIVPVKCQGANLRYIQPA